MIPALAELYVKDPSRFWLEIMALAPAFVIGFGAGMLDYSRFLHGIAATKGSFSRFFVGSIMFCATWSYFLGTLASPFSEQMTLALWFLFILLVIMSIVFPLATGMVCGMKALQLYWFIKRKWYAWRDPDWTSI
jgi:hypothetical protein